MDIFNCKKAVIKIPVMNNDNYAELTDDDYVSYSLYDLEGNIVDDIEEEQLDIDSLDSRSFIEITIPEEANVIDDGKEFDNRILIVNYTLNQIDRSERKTYRIIPFIPYVCNNDDVRKTLGVASTVVEDDMIDIYAAYLKCKSLLDEPEFFDSYLISGDQKTSIANRAITICAALSFRSSLPLLTPKIESDGVTSQTRFTMTVDDFNKLFDSLEGELQELLDDLEDVDVVDSYDHDMFVVGNLTDTFTGS